MTLQHPSIGLLDRLDGFRVEVDEACQRGDVILDRPPLNVVTMPQRDQLRAAFEALDAHPDVRVIVLRAIGEHFSSGGDIKGFLEASPETVAKMRAAKFHWCPPDYREDYIALSRKTGSKTARAAIEQQIAFDRAREDKLSGGAP